jgi:uncharacterized protein YgfB (UPF0149 family)
MPKGKAAFDDTLMAQLWQLQLKTLEELGASELVFSPLIPEDDDDLGHRVTRCRTGARAFLIGFGTAVRPNDTRVHEESVRETLAGHRACRQCRSFCAQDNDEGDEFAYAELYEFVRMAAIHLFEEMAPPEEQHPHNEDVPENPTLH